MIRLISLVPAHILYEASAASAEAKDKGYQHVGFGNWRKGDSGPVIARTDKKTGKLVPIGKANGVATKKGKQDAPTRVRKPKPDAETKSARGRDEIKQIYKTAGGALRKALKGEHNTPAEIKGVVDKLSQLAVMNPNRSSARAFDKHVPYELYTEMSPSEMKELKKSAVAYMDSIKAAIKKSSLETLDEMKVYASFNEKNSISALKTLKDLQNQGIRINSISTGSTGDHYNRKLHREFAQSHGLKSIRQSRNTELSARQIDSWRSQMPDIEVYRFYKNQFDWQQSGAFVNPDKTELYKYMNGVTRRYGVPDAGVKHVYRGMNLSHANGPAFLSHFKVGSAVVSPPSGYTSSHKVATEFATGGDLGVDHHIVINMKSAGDGIKGIHMAHTYRAQRKGPPESDDAYTFEREIVAPSTMGQTVSDMQTDVIRKIDPWVEAPVYEFVTNISMIQDAEMTDEKTIYEAKKPRPQDDKTAKKLFVKYMGGSVRGPSKTQEKDPMDHMGGTQYD